MTQTLCGSASKKLSYDQRTFWQETGTSQEEFGAWVAEHPARIKQITADGKLLPPLPMGEGRGEGENQTQALARLGVVECVVELDDGKTYMQRVLLGEFTEQTSFDAAVKTYVEQVTSLPS